MLSFYLVGINGGDLFTAKDYKDGRLSYNRAKTVSRKGDESFISIKVEQEAQVLFEKYRDKRGRRVFNFYHHYTTPDSFLKAVNVGLKQVCEAINKDKVKIEEDVSTYYARGSWSTIARNNCKVPKEDIHFALNHSDPSMKVTDLYIEEDFSIIDRANRKVIDLINKTK
jgi:integrase